MLRIPLPNAPGGSFMQGLGEVNSLSAQNLDNRMKELQNQYYGPNIQSEINNRNALTQGYNIANQFAPDRLRLANQLSQQQLNWNPTNWQSQNLYRDANTNKINQMLPLEVQEQTIKNQYLPGSEQARINYQNMGGGRGSAAQKDLMAFENQLQTDNPVQPNESPDQYSKRMSDLSDAYGRGDTHLENGQPVPPMSWKLQQLQNSSMNRNIPVAAKNQLIGLDTLVEDMRKFDINAVADFAGPQGKVRLVKAKAQMAANPNDPSIDPMARRYLSAMNQSIINMDQMRKAFGTSVVPDYVYQTLGRLTNPNDSIWNDKTQVKQSYKDVVDTLDNNRNNLRNKYRGGINAPSINVSNNEGSKNTSWPANKEAVNEKEVEGKTPPKGTIWMIRPDGMKVPVHKENVEHAINKYNYRKAE